MWKLPSGSEVLEKIDEEFKETLTALGETPLPKHIDRETTEEDTERFQTIYAKHEGAVSAPTAGMHFSKILMKQMECSVRLAMFHPS